MGLLADRRFELAGSVPEGVLAGDPDRLAQALRNLIGNAIEHTAPGVGLVRLRVEALRGGRLRLLVEDDGPGIPARAARAGLRSLPSHRRRARPRLRRHRARPLDRARDRRSRTAGDVSAGSSPEDGARIELVIAGFAPSPPPRAHPAGPAPLAQDAGVPERVAARLGPHQ